MKKIFITLALCMIFSLFVYDYTNADAFKWIRVGRLQDRIVDSINQGESMSGRWMYYYYDGFGRENTQQSATYLFCTDWTDHNGTSHPIKQTGVGGGRVDELTVTMPVPDAEDITLHTYYRNTPPTITVDGWRIEEFFPQAGEEVAPDKIPGTADIMVESTVNTDMGVTIHQKVLAWSQMNHDDYHIYDWTFTNTGNVDLDDEIELQGQTINNFYIWRATRFGPARIGRRYKNWYSRYGEHPTDSLRIRYAYSARRSSASFDDVGYPRTNKNGWLNHPEYAGEATLYVQKDPDDLSDWEMQPSVSGNGNCDVIIANWLWYQLSSDDIATQYSIFNQGFDTKAGKWDNVMQTEAEGIWPGSKHAVRMDEQGLKWVKDNHFYTWHPWTGHSSGPWDLEFGESIRYVYSKVMGSISPRLGWDVGAAWFNDEAEPPPGMVYGVTDNMPPQYTVHPDLYDDENDWAKDCWVFTGKDSLFKNSNASQWAVRNNYDIPVAPPAPSIEIKSLPDKIRISWDGTESEKASDFAGYRIYRAVPTSDSCFWKIIADISGSGTYQYDDATASRGIGYAYYVTAYDDGVGNATDVNGRKEVLESGMYFNETSLRTAHLTRPPGSTLSDIRVVPNPFNIGAEDLQYPGEPDKIMFLDVPGYCTIKIYTESGDLIKTLYHTDGSGDEAWGDLLEEHSATDDGQIVVSGIYIAVIEENNEDGTPTGNTHFVKFVIVR